MPRITDADHQRQLTLLADILDRHPEGLGRAAIEAEYQHATQETINWRTLLRRLDELIARGRVVPEGKSSARVYRSTSLASDVELAGRGETSPEAEPTLVAPVAPLREYKGNIPISAEGAEIQALILRDLSERPPVGYQPEFLEQYEPGATWYLPAELRDHLYDVGRTPSEERPAGTYAREIFEHLLIDLSWSSSRLEGNQYNRLDTAELLRFGREAEGKNATDTQMILNHRAAIEMLVEQAEEVGFNRYTFLGLHAALSENLLGDRLNEGSLRKRLVAIRHSKFTPLAVPQKIEEHFDLLLAKADAIPDPFEQAFFVMVHLPYLQPFIDVNKRTSRLGANIPLIKNNLCPLSFVDVPEDAYVDGTLGIYELQRVELLRDVFVWAYERSCAQYAVVRDAIGKPDPIRLAYREMLRAIVQDLVLRRELPEPAGFEAWARDHGVPQEDVTAFAQSARAELLELHEGSLSRYRLRPSQFEAWKESVRGQ